MNDYVSDPTIAPLMSLIGEGAAESSTGGVIHRWKVPIVTRYDRALPYCVGILGYYVFTILVLWHTPNNYWGMYGNTDGMWSAWTTEAVLKWAYTFDFSPYNILSGMGSMFPPNLPWLNPGALSLGLPLDRGARYVVSYSVYFIELLVSLTVLMRVIGLSPLRSIVAAQIYTLILFPPTSEWFVALSWYSLAPFYAHLAALANFGLCIFLITGRYRPAVNLACVAGMLALMLSAIVSAAVSFLTYVPVYVLMGLAFVAERLPRRKELLWKIGLVIGLVTISLLLAFPDYLAVTRDLSARTENLILVPGLSGSNAAESLRDAWHRFDICSRPQELLCRKYPIFWFHLSAIAGAVIAFFNNRSLRLRVPAAVFLIYYALVHAWQVASDVQLFGKLHVISVPYLVWAAYPFFALFSTILVFSPYDFLRRRFEVTRSGAPSKAAATSPIWFKQKTPYFFPTITVVTLVIPVCAYLLWKYDVRPFQPPKQAKTRNSIFGASPVREPVLGPVTRYLIDHASLAPGGPFRGYTVTYFGDPAGHIRKHLEYSKSNMGWKLHVASRQYLDAHYGNRFQEMDLWQFDIPTVEEYGQWVTKQVHAFATQLFSSAGDEPNGIMLHIYKLEPDLLRAIGVRFIITDVELADRRLTLRAQQQSPTAGPIYLYELASPNLATYSPTEIAQVGTFSAAMDLLRQNSAHLDQRAVVFDTLDNAFTAASQSTMLVERDGFRVVAKSPGLSLLVLPVQYSHCLKIIPQQSSHEPSSSRLMRVNGIQTLLVFNRDVDIRVRFEFGLLGTAECRRQDIRDLKSIAVSD